MSKDKSYSIIIIGDEDVVQVSVGPIIGFDNALKRMQKTLKEKFDLELDEDELYEFNTGEPFYFDGNDKAYICQLDT